MSTWTCMNVKGQSHSLTLVQGHSESTFSNFFSWETARLIEAKFHVEPQWDGGTKVFPNGPGLMTKIAAMAIHGKKKKKWKILLLWNQMADDLESLYAALGTQVLPNLFKWWPWVDLDIFYYGKVKSGLLCFKKKVKTMNFSETIVVYDIKVGRCSQLNKNMKLKSTKGQGHWLTLIQISQIQYF